MPWKLRIWIAGLFVASMIWGLFLASYYYPYPEERANPVLIDAIALALGIFFGSGIFPGIYFAVMKFRKEKVVTALWIWTFFFLIGALDTLNY